MIRRDATSDNGQTLWILIPQIEHARISAELARAWRPAALPAPPHREPLLAAIEHHDDGWADWDAAPDVDPRTGTPRDFTEMPLGESLAIWRNSIASGARIGPLAAYAISGHFSALLRQFTHWRSEPAPIVSLGDEFLREQDVQREHWFRDWSEGSGGSHLRAAAELAVTALQFFDRLSLWICCTPRAEPLDVMPPGGGAACRLSLSGENRITIHPWPLQVEKLEVAAPGRSIRARPYTDRAALAGAEADDVTLKWTIVASLG